MPSHFKTFRPIRRALFFSQKTITIFDGIKTHKKRDVSLRSPEKALKT